MQDHVPLRKKSRILQQLFVTCCLNTVMFTVIQENPGNNKDLNVHVLHEGQVLFFGK